MLVERLKYHFQSKTILVIGDVMIDAYRWGKVTRISPEAPVPVLDLEEKENRLGGAANVALNLKGLGATTYVFSVVGKDEGSGIFLDLMQEADLAIDGIIESEYRRTTVKTRLIANNNHLLRVDEEQTDELNAELENELYARLESFCNTIHPDAIIFEDYDKGVLSESLIFRIMKLANEMDIFTAVDPKHRNFLHYHYVNLFKPNFRELADGLNVKINANDMNSLELALNLLHQKIHNKNTLLTLSEHGLMLHDTKHLVHFPALKRSIADVSGAGDTVIAVATLGMISGLSLAETAWIANLAGGFVCEKPGVYSISIEELKDELKLHPIPHKHLQQ
jgi:D-glycero-beta-D-manno-heptose-7-phosphate kinase